ncbi:MAG: hypothetical protein O3A88_08365, partial [Proteobacteria bacterium]|nr:hypothetical protein [Pseudomonadota bacterium]
HGLLTQASIGHGCAALSATWRLIASIAGTNFPAFAPQVRLPPEAAQTANLKGKAASEEAASLKNYRSSVKVVAGAGFGLCDLFEAAP